jgi:hypothetical protein
MRRVDAYLSTLKSASTASSSHDADLLPVGHPQAGAMTAYADEIKSEMTVTLRPFETYANADEAIVALAEFSSFGYGMVPCLRAAWKRGVEAGESGFTRAGELAVKLYDSSDADLLPKRA